MYFLQISDTHFLTDYRQTHDPFRFGLLRSQPLEEKLHHLASTLQVPLDFIAHCGDLTHSGGVESYHQLRQALARHFPETPVLAVPGNHDHPHLVAEVFTSSGDSSSFPGQKRHFHQLQVLSVDNTQEGNPEGAFTQEICQWLLEQLAEGQDSLLLCHHHPIPGQSPMASAQLHPLFHQVLAQKSLKAILCGHTHHPFAGDMGGVPCYTVGSMSFLGREVEPGRLLLEESAHYHLFAYQEGQITLAQAEDLSNHQPLGFALLG